MKSRDAALGTAPRQPAAVRSGNAAGRAVDGLATTSIGALQAAIDRSPRTLAQRRAMDEAFGTVYQRAGRSGTAVIQREDDWALESNKKVRRALDKTAAGKRFEFRFDHGDEAGFGTTLHHHISRAKMSEIVTSFKASQRHNSKMKGGIDKSEYQVALSGFERTVNSIAKAADLASQDLETLLHNLPLNLHYGPSIVKDDPGHGFDPSTRPRANTDGERELEPTSSALLNFLNTYQGAVDQLANDSDGSLSPETWTTLADQLQVANSRYEEDPNVQQTEHGGIAVNQEQWITTDGSDTWAKRGLNKWPALNTARQRFQGRVGPLPAGALALSAHHDFTVLDNGGNAVTFRIGYSGADLVHFCNRHTYRHFNTAEIKLLNTFFPAGTNQAAVVLHVQNAFADIEAELRRYLPAGQPDYEITGALSESLAADGLDFSANNRLMTIIEREDLWNAAGVDGAVELVSFVPVGPNFESYEASLLTALNLP